MKRICRILLLPLLLMSGGLFPQGAAAQQTIETLEDANEVLEQAHLAFERGETEQAMELYLQVAQSGFGAAKVWANAGTAAYRSGDTGRAVLYYSRALRQDPGNERAIRSLDFVSPATNQGDSFAANAIEDFLRRTSPGVFVLLAELTFLIICYSIVRLFSTSNRDVRGHWWAVFGWCFLLTAILAGLAVAGHKTRVSSNDAVVIEDGAIIRSAPEQDATAKLEIPAGTILDLTENPRRGFVRVRMTDGNEGYLSTGTIERI